jgi:hypothetical protein
LIIIACDIEIFIYESNSLKNKRQVIKSIINRARERYNVSVGETDFHEKWNRSVISIANVSNSKKHGEEVIDKAIGFVNNDERVEILNVERYEY